MPWPKEEAARAPSPPQRPVPTTGTGGCPTQVPGTRLRQHGGCAHCWDGAGEQRDLGRRWQLGPTACPSTLRWGAESENEVRGSHFASESRRKAQPFPSHPVPSTVPAPRHFTQLQVWGQEGGLEAGAPPSSPLGTWVPHAIAASPGRGHGWAEGQEMRYKDRQV